MLKEIFKQKEGRVVAGNYVSLLFVQAANFILPLITLPYLVRTLGTEKFGIVMIAQALGVFLTVIVDFGFNISGTREVSLLRGKKNELSQFYFNVLSIKILLLLFTALLLVVLIVSFQRFRTEAAVYLLSFLMVIGQAIFPAWFFQGIEKMRTVTIINVVAKLVFTISIFVVVVQPSDYYLVPLCHGGGFILVGVFGLWYSFKHIVPARPQWAQVKEIAQNTSSLFVSNFATNLYTSSNTFILGMFGGDAIAGVYSSMEKLVLALKNVFIPLYQAIFPWLATKKHAFVHNFIKKARLPIGLVGGGMALGIFFFAKFMLHIIYNDATIAGYSAVFQVLGMIALFSSLNMLVVTLYLPAIKAYKKRMITLVKGGVFNLVLAVVLVNFFNIYGVAVAAVTTEFFILILAWAAFGKYTPKTLAG